ncbi:DMT family transporter [Alphaproteobacteria bacterium KMM 3653]|uniref:DMT family transporter n=2 Tax=Harenicola maris TaxID=2841044 RepID=A0AAP2CNB6_9RHOB|nr:DMT family transporter [Harenicola maris]
MCLNIWALTIVKSLGLGYPAAQLVFLRASVGLLLMLPWIFYARGAFRGLDRFGLHALRVAFSALALSCSFFAISRLPFALFSAISFTRPVVMMVLAAVILREVVPRRRWAAAGVAFIGVMFAVQPGQMVINAGLPAMFATVLFGTSAIIVTRRLVGAPMVVMMTFYTLGLTVLTAPFALAQWVPIPPDHLWPLLAIGVFSQCAQFCFLRAHGRAEVGFLAILGYSSLILTTLVGYFVFGERPSAGFFVGAALIIGAASVTSLPRLRWRM